MTEEEDIVAMVLVYLIDTGNAYGLERWGVVVVMALAVWKMLARTLTAPLVERICSR